MRRSGRAASRPRRSGGRASAPARGDVAACWLLLRCARQQYLKKEKLTVDCASVRRLLYGRSGSACCTQAFQVERVQEHRARLARVSLGNQQDPLRLTFMFALDPRRFLIGCRDEVPLFFQLEKKGGRIL